MVIAKHLALYPNRCLYVPIERARLPLTSTMFRHLTTDIATQKISENRQETMTLPDSVIPRGQPTTRDLLSEHTC